MANEPAISVITPVYNAGELLLEAAASLQAQTFRDFEWLVVDDGSDGLTRDLLETLDQRVAVRVRLLRLEHKGAAAARNLGIENAAGRYLKFLDADDFLEARCLELQAAHIDRPNDPVIASRATVLFHQGDKRLLDASYNPVFNPAEDLVQRFLVMPYWSHCVCLFPRELVARLGGMNENLATDEDGDFLLRVLLERPQIIWEPGAIFVQREHCLTDRLTVIPTARKLNSRLSVCRELRRRFTESGDLPRYAAALAGRYDSVAQRACFAFPDIAAQALQEAIEICPDYVPPDRYVIRVLRKCCGLAMAIRVRRLLQEIQRRVRLRRYGIVLPAGRYSFYDMLQ